MKLTVTLWRLLILAPVAVTVNSQAPRCFAAPTKACASQVRAGAPTQEIQRAIDRCAASGGGTLTLPAGEYTIRPLQLRSHINLHLDAGAVLRGVTDMAAYPVTMKNIWQGKPQDRPLALIGAVGQTDVALTGPGVVDGQGGTWWKEYHERRARSGEEMARPWLVQFTHCDHVLVDGVQMRDSPSYTLVFYLSHDVAVNHVKILAPPDSPNTDGIVPYSSQHVRIADSIVDSGDDNVAIKSSQPLGSFAGADFSASDISVKNCTFVHGHGATIGADTGGGVHDVLMEDIVFQGTTNGVRIKSGRGLAGDVSNITYRHLRMTNTSPAIALVEYYPSVPAEGQEEQRPMTPLTPHFHGVRLDDITATGGKDAGTVIGLPESPISDLLLTNVHINASTGLIVRNATVSIGSGSRIQAANGESIVRQRGAKVISIQ